MGTKVFIDGQVFDGDNARISVFDRGFLYGDSIYEVLRTSGGKLVDLERHLARLQRSAEGLVLAAPPLAEVRAAIRDTLDAAGNDDSYLRIIVTRGAGEVGLDTALADRSTLLVIVRPLALPARDLYEHGADVRIVGVRRTSRDAMDPAVKSGNYLNNILALAEARKHKAYEALMCDAEGWVAEGSSSNVFIVRGGTIATPELSVGILQGITRQRVLELASSLGLEVIEGRLLPEDLHGADEAFLTSSVRGVLPIRSVDGIELADGAPGPVTRRLLDAYQQFLVSVAEAG